MENLDLTSEVSLVRIEIGDVVAPFEVTNEVIQLKLNQYSSSSQVIRIWKASIDCLRILKAKYAALGSRRREREGGVEIEDYGRERFMSVSDLLDWLLQNPPESAEIGGVLPYFGGTVKSDNDRWDTSINHVDILNSPTWFDKEDHKDLLI